MNNLTIIGFVGGNADVTLPISLQSSNHNFALRPHAHSSGTTPAAG